MTRRANELGDAGIRFAENLRRVRISRPMTTERLAERVTELGRPMYANTITKIEKQQRRVDVDDLAALASALGVTVTHLLDAPSGCATCHGTPPPGFICAACGAGPVRPDGEPTA